MDVVNLGVDDDFSFIMYFALLAKSEIINLENMQIGKNQEGKNSFINTTNVHTYTYC